MHIRDVKFCLVIQFILPILGMMLLMRIIYHERERGTENEQRTEKLSVYKSVVLSQVGKINMDNTWM